MNIKLTEQVGAASQLREAVVKYNITTADFAQLCRQMQMCNKKSDDVEGLSYTLANADAEIEHQISLCHIPPLYNELFDALFKNLQLELAH